MDDDLGVGVGSEAVALAFEFAAQLREVVDLAVICDPDGSVFVAHRHVADGGQIENGEAAAAQADVGTIWELAVPKAGVVWAAMRLNLRHARQRFPISAIHYTADSAHDFASSPVNLAGAF